jgi:uracil-DNA glycosylase family 4
MSDKLKVIQAGVNSCTKCELHKTKTNYVFSRGNPEAKIVICAEAPGENEDKTGYPLVGLSGQLLDQTVKDIGLDPEKDIYVCNILKCRPPGNRKPTDEEVNHCIDWLEAQLDAVSPGVILTLGNTATQTLANTSFGISKVRGKFLRYRKTTLIPTYHPSYLLRSGGVKSPYYADFVADLKLAIPFKEGLKIPQPICDET